MQNQFADKRSIELQFKQYESSTAEASFQNNKGMRGMFGKTPLYSEVDGITA